MTTLRRAHLTPYIGTGAALWFVGMLILWFRIGASFGISWWPFFWAYSQLALVMAVVGEQGSWIIHSAVWLATYLAFGVSIWWLVGRMRPESWPNHWLRSTLGWLVVQVLLGVTAWALAQNGLLPME